MTEPMIRYNLVECGLGPERRPEGLNAAERIVEEEPGAVLHLIAQHPEKKEDDDQNHGGDVAACRLCGEIKRQTPEENKRHHYLKDHPSHREIGQREPAEENQGQHQNGDDHIEGHQAGQPDLVAVVRNAEQCFHHPGVLVPLDAVNRGIKDEQNTGSQEIIVKPFRIGRSPPSQQADDGDQEKEPQGQPQEDDKPSAEDVKGIVSQKGDYGFDPVHGLFPSLRPAEPISHM